MEHATKVYIDEKFENTTNFFKDMFKNIEKNYSEIKMSVKELLEFRMADNEKIINLSNDVKNNTKDINNIANNYRDLEKRVNEHQTRIQTMEDIAKAIKVFFVMVIIQGGGLILSIIGLVLAFIKMGG